MKPSLSLALLLIIALASIHVSAQNVLIATSADETLAGTPIGVTLRFEKGPRGKIVGFFLKIFIPKNWTIRVSEMEVIDPKGNYLTNEVKIINETAFEYHGEREVTAGHLTLIVTPPVYSPTKTYKFEVTGYLEVKTPSGDIVKAFVSGESKVLVRHWEPFVVMNLSKGIAEPPDIVVAQVVVSSRPPLPRADMKDVNVLITSSVSGVLFNKTILYWPYGHPAAVWRVPIKISPETKPGDHLIKVKVSYTIGSERFSTEVNGTFRVVKPSVVRVETLNYSKVVRGGYAWINATLVNPSPYPARNVEFHVKLGNIHKVRTFKTIAPGEFVDLGMKIKVKSKGSLPVQVWLVWTSEYPKEIKYKTLLNTTIEVIEEENFNIYWLVPLVLVVLGVAAVKFLVKRRRSEKAKGDMSGEGLPKAS